VDTMIPSSISPFSSCSKAYFIRNTRVSDLSANAFLCVEAKYIKRQKVRFHWMPVKVLSGLTLYNTGSELHSIVVLDLENFSSELGGFLKHNETTNERQEEEVVFLPEAHIHPTPVTTSSVTASKPYQNY
ncbi:hypothetical protein STEG23_010931, partial [Scotinomys teguina]